jgi:hypothetical protein
MALKSTIRYPYSKCGEDQIQVSMAAMKEEKASRIPLEA